MIRNGCFYIAQRKQSEIHRIFSVAIRLILFCNPGKEDSNSLIRNGHLEKKSSRAECELSAAGSELSAAE